MSKLEKLVASLLNDAGDYSYSDAKKVLSDFGFKEVRVKGSHHTFRHEDGRTQVIPLKHGKRVKKVYIKEIVQLLELKEWYEQQQ